MNVFLNELHAYHHEVASKITHIKALLKRITHGADGADDCELLFEMLEALRVEVERHHHENEELKRSKFSRCLCEITGDGIWLILLKM